MLTGPLHGDRPLSVHEHHVIRLKESPAIVQGNVALGSKVVHIRQKRHLMNNDEKYRYDISPREFIS